jgi:hypothetical protein
MKPSYQIVDRKDSQGFARYLAKNGQLLLPLVELIEASRMAVDELIDVLGRANRLPSYGLILHYWSAITNENYGIKLVDLG